MKKVTRPVMATLSDGIHLVFGINGWMDYSRSYFFSYGISNRNLERMYYGEEVSIGNNTFSITCQDEYGHTYNVEEVMSLDEFLYMLGR